MVGLDERASHLVFFQQLHSSIFHTVLSQPPLTAINSCTAMNEYLCDIDYISLPLDNLNFVVEVDARCHL